jgi:hypothetical protein
MNAATFAIMRAIKGDAFLNNFSASHSALLDELSGKSIAIVGNARSLSEQNHGQAIDICDVVIRMHAAPLPNHKSHGSKTTWLALGMPVDQSVINSRTPDRLLWMAKKRKRLRYRIARAKGFYLHPKSDWENMAKTLSAPPTTGAMLIDMVAHSKASDIHLFGFDFFASLSLSGRRTAAQVPHDFTAEKQFVERLMQNDPRVVLHGQTH